MHYANVKQEIGCDEENVAIAHIHLQRILRGDKRTPNVRLNELFAEVPSNEYIDDLQGLIRSAHQAFNDAICQMNGAY